ncbi:MAG: hypothetical protein GF317_03515 [Candidatus Lokiarchaeota archaeon]|nr:hypothetical protein [Candidatus Lokiarchaeota archaeon]MBD3198964.1 hypothetical protein [Candidatus Lokiarchaeota archaeon]
MACEECLGLFVISIISFIIGFYLANKYMSEKNQFTLYMVFFFILAGIGWLIWFVSTELVLNIYNFMVGYLLLIGLVPQLILLLFILTFFEVSYLIRVIILVASIALSVIHVIFPEFRLLTILSTIIITANIVLFIINWKRNEDIKSLGFALGLLVVLVGEALISLSDLIHGVFLIIAAVIWLITYSGLLDKFQTQ